MFSFRPVFAVGAYESDTVAVLRANPVVSMETQMYVRPDRITASEPQVFLTVCFKYTGGAANLPTSLRKCWRIVQKTAYVIGSFWNTILAKITLHKTENHSNFVITCSSNSFYFSLLFWEIILSINLICPMFNYLSSAISNLTAVYQLDKCSRNDKYFRACCLLSRFTADKRLQINQWGFR